MERSSILLYVALQRQLKTTYRFRDFFGTISLFDKEYIIYFRIDRWIAKRWMDDRKKES